jgi:hypothetical protein
LESRIVICMRVTGSGQGLLERGRTLDARAAPKGGVLIAWGACEIAFAYPADAIERVLELAATADGGVTEDDHRFSIGIAQGEIKRLAENRGALAWGPPLVAASALAAAARPGEVLCSPTLRAARSGELLSIGSRIAKVGEMTVRGMRVDRARPWRRQAVEQLAYMRVARLVGVEPLRNPIAPGSLVVLRADPGAGGTRWLNELAARAPRALVVSPSGSGFEPLGALRRAIARSIGRDPNPLLLELAEPLERMLGGSAVSLDKASRLVTASLWRRKDEEGNQPGLVVVDDAKAVDPATLEACVRAARADGATLAIVARLDATGSLPTVLTQLPRSIEVELKPLQREAAEALAGGCTNDALDAIARKRWARLGGNAPLGIVESVAWGIVSGELAWEGEHATPRSRASGRGKVRPATEWISLRARDESDSCRTLLGLIALLGGEAKVSRLAHVLERAEMRLDVEGVVEELIRSRWLVDTQEDWVALSSRTHRDALASLLEEGARTKLHLAAAHVIEEQEGKFGRVEAAFHASQAGESQRASGVLITAARATAEARFEATTTQLVAFARRADPTCEDSALEILANALARGIAAAPSSRRSSAPPAPRRSSAPPKPSITPSAPPEETHDSEPPTIAKLDLPPVAPNPELGSPAPPEAPPAPPESSPTHDHSPEPAEASIEGTNIATRLAELAKEALLSADNAALERWVDGLRATGESPIYTDRMRALSRLGRGDIGDALRVLRRTRAQLDLKDHRVRCQTSLALGVALSLAGRPEEALLEGLDALARARQIGDEAGAMACVAFLAKLYTSIQRPEAERLRSWAPAATG